MKISNRSVNAPLLTVAAITMTFAVSAKAACGSRESTVDLSSRLVSATPLAIGRSDSKQRVLEPADVPAPSIVGLWSVTFYVGVSSAIYDQGFEQWHSDGTELNNDNAVPPTLGNVCVGVWKQTGPQTVKLRHVTWNWDANNNLAGTFLLLATITLDAGGNSYTGTYTADSFDLTGKVIPDQHAEGNLKGTRIEVDAPSVGNASAGVTIVVTGTGATSTSNVFEAVSSQVALDASTSTSENPGALTYFWSSAPGYPVAAILGAATAKPLIQLPSRGVYQFSLTVTDAGGVSASTTVTVRYK